MNLNLFPQRNTDQKSDPSIENTDLERKTNTAGPGPDNSSVEHNSNQHQIPSADQPHTADKSASQAYERKPADQQNSTEDQKRTNSDQSQQIQVPVESLIKNNRIVIFDSSALTHSGFPAFVQANALRLQTAGNLFNVPHFTLSAMQDNNQKDIQQLLNSRMLSMIGDIADAGYEDLFRRLVEMKAERNQVCFVVNQWNNRSEIIKAAKATGLFVQLFTIDENGNLNTKVRSRNGSNSGKRRNGPQPVKKESHQISNLNPDHFNLCTEPEQITISSIMPGKKYEKNDIVYDSRGRAICLGNQQFINPNAITYDTDADGMFAKIYNPSSLKNTFLEEKAKRMVSKNVSCKGLCWPIDILRDSEGHFVGILVPPAKGEPLHLAIFKEANLKKYFPDWDKKDLCDLAVSILKVIQYLHSMNILMGCINPASIRIAGKDEVYFMDTDDYQVEGFPTLFHNTTFTPPELLGKELYLCSKENENYAVAILTFMLMMPGKLPYTKKENQTWNDAIRAGNFPFSYKTIHRGSHSVPSTWRFMWSHLTPFKEPFYDTFQKDGKYTNPEDRLTVDEWLKIVQDFRNDLENQYDPESLKLFPRTFKRLKGDVFYKCSICGVEHPRFYFNDKYFDEFQICNECLDKPSDVSFTCKACNKTYIYNYETKLFHQTMKKLDSDWHDQKYCRDCKKKTLACLDCGKIMPYYYLREDGRCWDCHKRYSNQVYRRKICKDCGQMFEITNREHEYYIQEGYSEPVRCKACRDRKKRSPNGSWK